MTVMSDRRDAASQGAAAPSADPLSRRIVRRDGRSLTAEWQLALPLGVFYCAFLFAPLGTSSSSVCSLTARSRVSGQINT